ncbi:MAG TPA: biopolymer transporter ExbD [Planctomycetota bacterium]|nr:biopolymer transporter ExbD [Planctomycetota bacterium]
MRRLGATRMRTSCILLGCTWLLCGAVVSADDADAPAPGPITRIEIHVFPNDVIVIRGDMITMKELRDHLAKLVDDARKPAVEVHVVPKGEAQMPEVARIVAVAKELGYHKVTYASPPKPKVVYTEIHILVSKTGRLMVGKDEIDEDQLRPHLEKLVPDEKRRKDVLIVVNASRLAKMKQVTAVTKLCREMGFVKVQLKVIPE